MPGKSYQNSIILFALCLFFLLATGCEEQQNSKTNNVPGKTHTEKLKLGLITEQDIFSQKKRYEPLAAYLSRKIDATIELSILSRYGNIIDNFVANGLDAAFFGSFTGALAIRKLEVLPLARPEYLDGTSTYYGMIFVRKDSGIHNAADMRGKRFAFVDKATTAGWLLPMHYFAENGIEDYYTYFSETYFTGTHEDAIYDVLNGKADIGAAKNTVFSRLAQTDSKVQEQLQILATSPVVPANALAVRKDLGESLKLKLKNALLQMDQDVEGRQVLHEFGARRFIPTTDNDYAPVFDYAYKIGLDLTTYDYNNE
ncbi:MAG: phosphate/phosphite/phosphonate ABC transporter substrate-binding protein [Proteobacteria bacterium]|nr:phosphate/phosphite/phosphonate ABC transporter substrate-binding protein [Pseudomonadota bacterium]MBU4298107.1 phosphate/phosphite/phosphonate ABC transporter substrate-binding protein [Pseudomonadota bacterium]MCG2747391.1 phosphate/phosphite/phosphonate ABC transporter substrate-binding protein [Desulfobulbaceae bacterium]